MKVLLPAFNCFAAVEALCNRLKQMTSFSAPSISDGNHSLLHAQLD
jgi:hypothetical protein